MQRAKIELEFIFRASPAIMYKYFIEPALLVRWYCDEVDINGNTFSFFWSGSEEVAELIEQEEDKRLRFHWEDSDEGEYFEIRLSKSPVTGETVLQVTDFCDDDEIKDQEQLWEIQVKRLKQESGG